MAICALVLTNSRALPVTIVEQLFSTVVMLSMGCVYAFSIGSICGIISTMDPAGIEFRNSKDLLTQWACEIDMSPELKDVMVEYIDECRWLIRQRYYDSLRPLLSPTLRGAISQSTHGKWLQSVPFFNCEDMDERRLFTMAIAESLSIVVIGKSERIVNAGEVADCM